jgi:outer membrane protein
MKKLNLIIEIVLTIAVIVLFGLHFLGNKSASSSTISANTNVTNKTSGIIVYVNIDTVIHNYDLYADLRSKLSGKQQVIEAEMGNKSKNYQSGVLDYQNKVQKGLITRATAAEMEQQLTTEQQKLLQLRDQYSMQLQEEEQVMNRQILNSITEYLTEYNKVKGYNYILGNSFGGNVLYADKTLDITQDVLKGLNAKYRAEKEKEPKAKK